MERRVGKRNLAAAIGGWSARHRWAAILLWVAFTVGATLVGNAVGIAETKNYQLQNGDSRKASKILDTAGFPNPAAETVLIEAGDSGLTVDDRRYRAAVDRLASEITATGLTQDLRTPYDTEAAAPVTADRKTALLLFTMKGERGQADRHVQRVVDAVAAVQREFPELRMAQAGDASSAKMIDGALADDFVKAELISIPLTLGILLAAFGALLAAVVPVALALTAFMASLGLLALASQAVPAADTTSNLMLLIGLAVGVDYSLFYIRREREERAKGRSRERALRIAAATSGRAVVISGITVIVALAGMFLTGNGVFIGLAEGAILVVLTAVLGSVTVLPAILSLIGDRIESRVVHGTFRVVSGGRITWKRVLGGRVGGGRLWGAVLSAVLRRPLVSLLVAGGLLVAMAAPALQLKTGEQGINDLQGDFPIVETFKRVEKAFPGGNEPARVVVKAADVTAPEVVQAIERFKERALATGQTNEPFGVRVNPGKTVAIVSIGLKGAGPGDAVSEQAVRTLRQTVVPATLPGVEVYVYGSVASSMDFNDQLNRTRPWVFAFVLLLAFILLLVSFRSLVVAIKAVVLNLLSVAAAYGALVAIFQWGWGESLLGFTSTGVITNWLPLFLFVILFGLSMDYHVFILSRIREAYDRGMRTEEAVTYGIKATAGVVTSAALIMVAVFGVFATLSLLTFIQVGVGLAIAILIDATIIRAVLLPAAMQLLGDRNWYLPRVLHWLPRLSHGEEEAEEDPAPAAVLAGVK
ncbi:MMPL family transporter [Rhizohabitans arisaemae]|uniref:MMPL family transporter n=1 Tax=Rhizohabitans arisaemae TaxID=2720610 RepID=UPI0024B19E0B|nr:MMPL family transporter [Rhizohabitans arisaemae]